jgi:hypothetical protein
MITYDYALVKYTPNPKRGEIINIGIIIFKNNDFDLRLLSGAAKLRLLDGTSSTDDILSIEKAINDAKPHCKNQKEFLSFLDLFRSSFSIGKMAKFQIDHEQQYEAQITRLFNDLVKPYSARESFVRTSRIQTLVKNKFESLNILAKSDDELSYHKVVQNYTLNEKSGFSADFLLKNGRYHISEVIDYNVNDLNSKFKETTLKVMTFMEGKKHLGDNTGCYFVYSAAPEIEQQIQSHLNLADDYSESMFNIASKQDERRYFDMISKLAGQDSPVFH